MSHWSSTTNFTKVHFIVFDRFLGTFLFHQNLYSKLKICMTMLLILLCICRMDSIPFGKPARNSVSSILNCLLSNSKSKHWKKIPNPLTILWLVGALSLTFYYNRNVFHFRHITSRDASHNLGILRWFFCGGFTNF